MTSNIIFIAALPEPTTGQSISNKYLLEKITKKCSVTVINTSPKSIHKSFKYHINRINSIIKAVVEISKNRSGGAIYTVYESGAGVIYNYIIVIAARIFKYNIYMHHHTSQHTKSKIFRFEFISKIAKNMTNIFLSREMKQDFDNNYGDNFRSFVVQNHSMISIKNNTVKKFQPEKISIGFISNITIEKGALRSLDCLRHLLANGINATLIMAGPVTNLETKALLLKAKEELGGNLKILGPIHGPEKQSFFDEIDLLIFPSSYKYEAQPLVVLEAMAAGIPVIVSKYGYISEIAPDSSFVCEYLDKFSDFVTIKIKKYISDENIYSADSVKCLNNFIIAKNESEAETTKLISDIIYYGSHDRK